MSWPSSCQMGRVGQILVRGQIEPLEQSRHETGASELPSAARIISPSV